MSADNVIMKTTNQTWASVIILMKLWCRDIRRKIIVVKRGCSRLSKGQHTQRWCSAGVKTPTLIVFYARLHTCFEPTALHVNSSDYTTVKSSEKQLLDLLAINVLNFLAALILFSSCVICLLHYHFFPFCISSFDKKSAVSTEHWSHCLNTCRFFRCFNTLDIFCCNLSQSFQLQFKISL